MAEIKLLNGIPELPKESFLSEAFEYTRKKVHTPDTIIFWSLIAMCGAALKDSMYFDFASKLIFPNFPLLIIAPSGVGKTSALSLLERIFEGNLPHKIPENCTSESFFKNFAIDGTKTELTTSCYWAVPEMADIFGPKDYQKGIVPRITRLLDNPRNLTVSRMQDKNLIIENTALLNWFCGSTYKWLIQYCEQGTATGGFLPRLNIIMCEDDPRFTEFPSRDLSYEYHLNSKLKDCLQTATNGPQPFSKETEEVRFSFHQDLLKCKDDDTRVFIARQWESYAKCLMIFSTFLGKFHTSSAIVLLAKKCSKLLLDNNLTLYRTIKMRNILPESKKTRKSLYNKLKRNLRKDLTYLDIMKTARITTKELQPALNFFKDHGVVVWDGKLGNTGIITPVADPEEFLEHYFNGIYVEDIEEALHGQSI